MNIDELALQIAADTGLTRKRLDEDGVNYGVTEKEVLAFAHAYLAAMQKGSVTHNLEANGAAAVVDVGFAASRPHETPPGPLVGAAVRLQQDMENIAAGSVLDPSERVCASGFGGVRRGAAGGGGNPGWRWVPDGPTPEWVEGLIRVRIGNMRDLIEDVLAAAPGQSPCG